ncbi:hypothetical protein ES703_94777 [subsurface metagenome]
MKRSLKRSLLIFLTVTVLLTGGRAYGLLDTTFTSSGQILPGEKWNNVFIYNDDTIVDMFYDAWVLTAITYDRSTFNIYGGTIDRFLTCSDNSLVNIHDGGHFGTVTVEQFGVLNIYTGNINALSATGGSIYLYAYDVTYDPMGGKFGEGELVGRYYEDDALFVYDLHEGAYSYITVVPEPTTLLLLGLGGFFLLRRRY